MPFPRPALSLPMLVVAVCILGAAPARLAAQAIRAQRGQVALTVTVPAQATIERVSPPTVTRQEGESVEQAVTVVVRGNAPYRLVARRVAAMGPAVTLGIRNGERMRLEAGRSAVQVGRGGAGVTTFQVIYRVDREAGTGAPAGIVRFEVVPG